MHYCVQVFKSSKATTQCYSGKTQYSYIDVKIKQLYYCPLHPPPYTLNINHESISIIQEMPYCEKIMIIHTIICFSMNISKYQTPIQTPFL